MANLGRTVTIEMGRIQRIDDAERKVYFPGRVR